MSRIALRKDAGVRQTQFGVDRGRHSFASEARLTRSKDVGDGNIMSRTRARVSMAAIYALLLVVDI